MGSQFVDLDADGHVDLLTAIFDGSPHVARGGEGGFAAPEVLKDKDGERVILSYLWDHEIDQHVVVERAMAKGAPKQERCISALAYDWDGDGDHDLLLGSYENGHLYRQMNEGTDAQPLYTGRNIAVMAGEKAFALPAKMTAPVLIDWDGDGDRDLVTGSFGMDDREGGGVYLSLNEGAEDEPKFGKLIALVEPSAERGDAPARPDSGLYPSVVDWDGDGDLDLLVGGYSIWQPQGRVLNAEEQARVVELKAEIETADASFTDALRRMNQAIIAATEGLERDSEEYESKVKAVRAELGTDYDAARDRLNELRDQLGELIPSRQRKPFVWFYERL